MGEAPRACILSPAGPELGADEARFLSETPPWGLILMGRSCQTPQQIRSLVEAIWNTLDRQCLIFIDQEGGRVQRLKPPHWSDFPPLGVYGDVFRQDPDAGRRATLLGHYLLAAQLRPMGIRADCAPVLDLQIEGADPIIGDRAFGSDPAMLVQLGRAALEGLAAGGVVGVIKHIPGHGRADMDSHYGLPNITASAQTLEQDFQPFSALQDAPMAMTAHIAYEAYDPGVAASVSPRLIESVIRHHIGFDGLLMSDDLGMKALGGGLSDRAEAVLRAGCDVALYCAGFERAESAILSGMREVAQACAPLSGRALERALAAEAAAMADPVSPEAAQWAQNLDAVKAEHRALLAQSA